jgi:hypothetical protein
VAYSIVLRQNSPEENMKAKLRCSDHCLVCSLKLKISYQALCPSSETSRFKVGQNEATERQGGREEVIQSHSANKMNARQIRGQVEVFWVATSCRFAVGYQRFGESFCFHLPPQVGGSTISYRNTTRWHNPEHLDLKN